MAKRDTFLGRERAKLVAQQAGRLANARIQRAALVQQGREHIAQQEQALPIWLTTSEACDYLHYTGKHRLRALYRFIERNELRVGRRSARKLLIRRADLDALVMEGGR